MSKSHEKFSADDADKILKLLDDINKIDISCCSERTLEWMEHCRFEIYYLSKDIISLFQAKRTRSIPIVYRCIFEAFINALILLKDDQRWITLESADLRSLISFQKCTSNRMKIKTDAIADNKARLKELESQNNDYSKNINMDYKLDNILNWSKGNYSIYRMLSRYIHVHPQEIEQINNVSNDCLLCLIMLLEEFKDKISNISKQNY